MKWYVPFFVVVFLVGCTVQGKTILMIPTGLANVTNGTNGANGLNGTDGLNGTRWYNNASTPPSSLGSLGDYYLNNLTGLLYNKTTPTTWNAFMNLSGTPGAPGAQGPSGPTGSTGPNGPAGTNGTNGLNATSNWTISTGTNTSTILNQATLTLTPDTGLTLTLINGTLTLKNTGVITENDPLWTNNASLYYLKNNPLAYYNSTTLPSSYDNYAWFLNLSNGNQSKFTNATQLNLYNGNGISITLLNNNLTITNTGILTETDPLWSANQSLYALTSSLNAGSGWTNTTGTVNQIDNTKNVSANTFFIDNTNGKIGIGTTRPVQTFEVVGGFNTTKNLYAGNGTINTAAAVNFVTQGFVPERQVYINNNDSIGAAVNASLGIRSAQISTSQLLEGEYANGANARVGFFAFAACQNFNSLCLLMGNSATSATAIDMRSGTTMILGSQAGAARIPVMVLNGTNVSVGNNLVFADGTNTRVGIGTSTPGTMLDVVGTLNATLLKQGTTSVCLSDGTNCQGNSSASINASSYTCSGTPSITALSGAGTSPTVSIVNATDCGMTVLLTTGTLPVLSADIFDVRFGNARPNTNYAVYCTPANANTQTLSGVSMVGNDIENTTDFTFQSGTSALTAATSYKWRCGVTG